MRTILALSLAVALAAAVPTAVSQTLPAPPSGFQANPKASARLMREAGVGDVVEATKANDNMTECYGDPKSLFTYGWNLNPAGKTTIDMMLKAPQDPATRSPNTMDLDEPVSKQAYKKGVLEWRKPTWPVVGGHPCKDKEVIFYSGHCMGYVSNKITGISVDRLYGESGRN